MYPNLECTSFIETAINKIRTSWLRWNDLRIKAASSNSTVAGSSPHKPIGNKLHLYHMISGLMRGGESDMIMKLFRESFNISIEVLME